MILLPSALAQDAVDIELVRPVFSAGAIPGTEAPTFGYAGTIRVGGALQYVRDPLVLYKFGEEQGAVVANRDTLIVGFEWQPTRAVMLRATLPVVAQWGGEVEGVTRDGIGTGNFSIGTKLRAWDKGPLAFAASGDLYLPTQAGAGWLGDPSIRFDASALGSVEFGPVQVVADLGTTLRPAVDTGYDFRLGSELAVSGAVRYAIWPERLTVQTALLYRGGFSEFFVGKAENPAEWLGGVELFPKRSWQLDALVGRGLTAGYGTSQFRALAAVTWIHAPPPPAPPPDRTTVEITAIPEELAEAEIAPEVPILVELPLARIVQDQIVIRDPIQFELATDRILPESLPTLRAIAAILADHPEILHIVIEGHASEEGTYAYNYNLSLTRAVAIFRNLVEVGVHPSRLSCRGMGEVVPIQPGEDEASLAINRRVIFHIVRRLGSGEQYPDYGKQVTVPWTGDTRTVTQPPPPPPPEPEPPPRVAPIPLDYSDFRDEEEPEEPPSPPPEATP